MSETVVVALCSFAATLLTGLGGYQLTAYRVEQLEKKVDKHNQVIERTYRLEEQQLLLEEKVKVANHRIEDLETSGGR